MTVGRHGRVTLEEAATAARKLFTFTRGDLASELGVKPVAVSRFLSDLIARELVVVNTVGDGGVHYRAALVSLGEDVFLPEPPAPKPPKAEPVAEPEPDQLEAPVLEHAEGRVTPEEVRDWAVMLGRFTTNQLAIEMEVGWATARKYLDRLVDMGIIVRVQDERGPSDAMLFELRGEVPERGPRRERRAPPELEVIDKWAVGQRPERGLPVPFQGAPKPSQQKDVNLLVAAAHAAGWPIENRAKHWVIVPPGADRPIPVPSTPKGPGMVRAFRDQLVRAGLPDIGLANEQPDSRSEHRPQQPDTARHHKRRKEQLSRTGMKRPGRRGKRVA